MPSCAPSWAQRAFVDLARKADSLPKKVDLAGWLQELTRIVSQKEPVDGRVTVTEQHDYLEGRVRERENEIQFQSNVQGTGRQVIPDGLLRKLGTALNDVAVSPKPKGDRSFIRPALGPSYPQGHTCWMDQQTGRQSGPPA